MSQPSFGLEMIAGVLLGALFITVVAITIRDQGREECEQKLPRTEKCIQQWVPEKVKAQSAEAA